MPAKGTRFNPTTGKYESKRRQSTASKTPTPGLTKALDAPDTEPPPPTPMPSTDIPSTTVEQVSTDTSGNTITAKWDQPVTIPPNADFYSEPLQSLEAGPIPVLIHRKRVGLGSGTDAPKEATWPSGWRLPQAGDSILIDGAAGSVTDVRFDLDSNRIIISIR